MKNSYTGIFDNIFLHVSHLVNTKRNGCCVKKVPTFLSKNTHQNRANQWRMQSLSVTKIKSKLLQNYNYNNNSKPLYKFPTSEDRSLLQNWNSMKSEIQI